MQITYPLIEPLLLDYKVEGSTIHCRFQVPGSERIVESSSPIRKTRTVKSQAADSLKRNVMNEVRKAAYSAVSQIFGSGFLGRTARSVTSSTLSQQQQQLVTSFSTEDKQQAAVDAFQKVAGQFEFDETSGTWQAPQVLSDFERHLRDQPVVQPFDVQMLKRMIVHLAAADGAIQANEVEFISENLGLSQMEIDELYLSEPVLAVECEEITPAVKTSVFLLVYALALADNRIDEAEQQQLDRYAGMLELSPETVESLATIARQHFLETLLRMGSGRERVIEAGKKIGMSMEDALRVVIRYRKKKEN